MKVALIQISAQEDKKANIQKATALVKRAIERRAKLIVLPEVFNFRGRLRNPAELQAVAEKIPGESLRPLLALARKHRVFICAGSIYEKINNRRKVFNTSVFIGPQGRIKAKYRKMNLFSAVLGQRTIKESDRFLPGQKPVTVQAGNFKIGLTICYDLRFPDLYRGYAQRGADVFCVPSAFTSTTGKAHWEVLLRARAIENFAYVLAPNQVGRSRAGIAHYGHSMIIGPWGEIVAQASGVKEEIIFADIHKSVINQRKKILPFLKKQRRY